MKIREANEYDAQSLSILIADARAGMYSQYTQTFLDENLPADSAEDIVDIMQRRTMFVAEEAEKIVGTSSLKEIALGMMFIDGQRQGQGIGRQLVEHTVDVARSRGLSTLYVYAALNAIHFYESCGFECVRPEISHASFPAMLMQRVIPSGISSLQYILLSQISSIDATLLKGIHHQSIGRQDVYNDVYGMKNSSGKVKAVLAGYPIYDFSIAQKGFELSVLNISTEVLREELNFILSQLAFRVYFTGGRFIRFSSVELQNLAILNMGRKINGEFVDNNFIMNDNKLINFIGS